MMIVGIGIAIVAVIAVFSMVSGGDDSNTTAPKTPPPKKAAEKPVEKVAAPVPKSADKAGKTPDRPAPTIEDQVMAKARAHQEKARIAYNECRTAKLSGKHAEAKSAAQVSWSELEKVKALIQPYLDWDEEAEIEGWAKPGRYVTFINNFYSKDYVGLLKNVRKQVR